MDDDAPQFDSGVGDDVVTIESPPRTVNWPLIAIAGLAVWWVWTQMTAEDTDEDG